MTVGVTAAGAIGGNEALTFAGIGSFIGGKSTIWTLVGAGAGFVVGSILQADELAESAENSLTEGTDTGEASYDENRFKDNSHQSIDELMASGDTPAAGNSEPDPFDNL